MEREDVQKLRSADPRRFRELAALAMGWTPPRVNTVSRPPFPFEGKSWDYFSPPPEVEAWRSDYHWRDPDGGCHDEPPDFGDTYRFPDYEALKYIRAKRDPDAIEAFNNALAYIWFVRQDDLPSDCWSTGYGLHLYEPGDYAAALLVAAGS